MLNSKSHHIPSATILVGIPTSGKSTWCKVTRSYDTAVVISRDNIRLNYFGKYYEQHKAGEDRVTIIFNSQLEKAIKQGSDIVFDNCHCREKYINELLPILIDNDYLIRIVYFDIPLWKAYYRNVKRWLLTGKYIPRSVIKSMKANYDKINRNKYAFYVW
jgi:predicted kinase